jgi:hypothetical protein
MYYTPTTAFDPACGTGAFLGNPPFFSEANMADVPVTPIVSPVPLTPAQPGETTIPVTQGNINTLVALAGDFIPALKRWGPVIGPICVTAGMIIGYIGNALLALPAPAPVINVPAPIVNSHPVIVVPAGKPKLVIMGGTLNASLMAELSKVATVTVDAKVYAPGSTVLGVPIPCAVLDGERAVALDKVTVEWVTSKK